MSSNGFYPPKCVRLKDRAFAHLTIRDWIIREDLSNGNLLLGLEEKGYTLEVTKDDIELVNDSP